MAKNTAHISNEVKHQARMWIVFSLIQHSIRSSNNSKEKEIIVDGMIHILKTLKSQQKSSQKQKPIQQCLATKSIHKAVAFLFTNNNSEEKVTVYRLFCEELYHIPGSSRLVGLNFPHYGLFPTLFSSCGPPVLLVCLLCCGCHSNYFHLWLLCNIQDYRTSVEKYCSCKDGWFLGACNCKDYIITYMCMYIYIYRCIYKKDQRQSIKLFFKKNVWCRRM